MGDDMKRFTALPWVLPEALKNFVPKCCRFFVNNKHGIFIAWRNGTALIYSVEHNTEALPSQKPLCNQVISSREHILDVITLQNSVYFVSQGGLFQALCSQQRGRAREVLDHLSECKTFYLEDAFELSPLKSILSINTVPEDTNSSLSNLFAVVSRSKDGSRIDSELYSVSNNASKVICHLEAVNHIHSDCPVPVKHSFSTLLTSNQANTLFPDLKDATIFIVALETGQLFCVPFYISPKKNALVPTPKLIYHASWPIIGLACPNDGCSILVFLLCGTFLNILARSSLPNEKVLSYDCYTLPYRIKSFAVSKHDLIVVTDSVTTNVITVVSPTSADINTMSVKGVSALCAIPGENRMIAATFHNVFYLLDPLNDLQREKSDSPPWAGCDLDASLQLVQDMKSQTKLLSMLRNELSEEDSIIKALSAFARAPLLVDSFTMIVKVTSTHIDKEMSCSEGNMQAIYKVDDLQQTYQMAVDIKNNSSEEFSSSLWRMQLEIRNQDGLTLSKVVSLSRSFDVDSPFSTTVNVPYVPSHLSFPVLVDASLVAEIKDKEVESSWMRIHIDTFSLDISHFFSVSLQPPQNIDLGGSSTIATLINQLHSDLTNPLPSYKASEEEALMTTYIIPIPEGYRQPHLVIEKILLNCWHRHKFATGKDLLGQSDKMVIWLSVLNKSVKLSFRKSCASLSLSSSDLSVLHSVKLCLSTMFREAHQSAISEGASDPSTTAYPKAKNLYAVLETLSLEEVQDGKQLLVIHQDLRNNVSSQLY